MISAVRMTIGRDMAACEKCSEKGVQQNRTKNGLENALERRMWERRTFEVILGVRLGLGMLGQQF